MLLDFNLSSFGGALVGLDQRFKSLVSLSEKVRRDLREANLASLEAAEQSQGEVAAIDLRRHIEGTSADQQPLIESNFAHNHHRGSLIRGDTSSGKGNTLAAVILPLVRVAHRQQSRTLDATVPTTRSSVGLTRVFLSRSSNFADSPPGCQALQSIVWAVSDSLRYTVNLSKVNDKRKRKMKTCQRL